MKIRIKKQFRWFLGILGIILLLSASGSYYENQYCQKLSITIDDNGGNLFLDEKDIQSLLDSNSREFLLNTPYKFINTRHLEKRLRANPFVEDCIISKKLNGELAVWVRLVKPIVRIWNKQETFYLDNKGKKIPFSKKFTPHCLIFSTDEVNFDFENNENDKELLILLQKVTSDSFFRSQIAQIVRFRQGFKIYLQLSESEIDFGSIEDWETKLRKLEILCKYILPRKGWNAYEKISLKYHQQVVCEYAKR
ncbi:cell division protein FtsQ/DivIB [Raineya orbicola]|jgi:cell division protein FtsQ|uniref:Cell division protein FtsQ n=1 Tax=Raineya orbicola TaxID=2016530 RepID=A0A2N3I4H9_9BACT|nr:hypothetical protein [Raineya orbicola]PKQ65215.1 hypothetical protein Rain11_2575 [Raineya orbicola]